MKRELSGKELKAIPAEELIETIMDIIITLSKQTHYIKGEE